jgi:hypothetical protein
LKLLENLSDEDRNVIENSFRLKFKGWKRQSGEKQW